MSKQFTYPTVFIVTEGTALIYPLSLPQISLKYNENHKNESCYVRGLTKNKIKIFL